MTYIYHLNQINMNDFVHVKLIKKCTDLLGSNSGYDLGDKRT